MDSPSVLQLQCSCGATFKVPAKAVGKTAICKKCGCRIKIKEKYKVKEDATSVPTSSKWFYLNDNEILGPISAREVQELALKNIITPETLVRKGSGAWIKAKRIKNLLGQDKQEKYKLAVQGVEQEIRDDIYAIGSQTSFCPFCGDRISDAGSSSHVCESNNNRSRREDPDSEGEPDYYSYSENDGTVLRSPRGFFATMSIAGLFFGTGMGIVASFKYGFGHGVITGIVTGVFFGFFIAMFYSGKRLLMEFKDRSRFIKLMDRSFIELNYRCEGNDGSHFVYSHNQGGIATLTEIECHVGRNEAMIVGPRWYVSKLRKRLSKVAGVIHEARESHGEHSEDSIGKIAATVAFFIILGFCYLLVDANTPEAEARHYVRSRLKSPTEANFVKCRTVGREGNVAVVHVVVDAPNSFGAKVRESYLVVVKDKKSIWIEESSDPPYDDEIQQLKQFGKK